MLHLRAQHHALTTERLRALDEPTILAAEKAGRDRALRQTAEAIAKGKGHERPTDDDRRDAEAQWKARAAAGVQQRVGERQAAIRRLLSSTSSALVLADALGADRVPGSVRAQVLSAAQQLPDATVRDLFERYVPEEKRIKRLGAVIKPADILAISGDRERGRQVFFRQAQCKNCHRIDKEGTEVGPDLTQIGKKLDRAKLLESLLEPSKSIDPLFVAYLIETKNGALLTGMPVSRSASEIVLKDAQGKSTVVPVNTVESMAPQTASLMPEQLLRDLTANEAADLLEFLHSLK